MYHLHRHRIRSGILAGTVVMAMGLLGGAAAAQAAPCVLTPATGSATQTDSTVTGGPADDTIDCSGATTVMTIDGNGGNDTITGNDLGDTINGGDGNDTLTGGAGNDTLNGGLGIDTINGLAGNDSMIGSGADGSEDSLFAGDGTDNCQGPPEDIINSCETTTTPPTTGPGSATASATDLCQAVGGTYSTVGPLGYQCMNIPVNEDHRAAEARVICVDRKHLAFLDLKSPMQPLDGYTCLA
jgi:hypothetical protein